MNTMTEAPLSANFNLYLGKVKFQFTYRQPEDTAYIQSLRAYLANLYADGFADEPQEPAEGAKLQDIDGYVAGMFQDNKSGDFKARLHLYAEPEGMKFRVVDVYPEDFEKLGFDPDLSKQVDGPAPEKAYAKSRGYYVHMPMKIAMVPKLDFQTGEPKRTEAGNPIYKFSHAVNPVTPANNGHHPANGNGHKPAPRNQATEDDQPFDDKSAGPTMSETQRKTMHALGTAAFGKDWDRKRALKAKQLGVSSSNDFTVSQATEIIENLEVYVLGQMYEIAGNNSPDWLDEVTKPEHKGRGHETLAGVALAKAYKLVKEASLPEELGEEELAF